jgi:hypothetical protein
MVNTTDAEVTTTQAVEEAPAHRWVRLEDDTLTVKGLSRYWANENLDVAHSLCLDVACNGKEAHICLLRSPTDNYSYMFAEPGRPHVDWGISGMWVGGNMAEAITEALITFTARAGIDPFDALKHHMGEEAE